MLQCLHSLTINISCWIKEKSSPEKQNDDNLVNMLHLVSLCIGRRKETFTTSIKDEELDILNTLKRMYLAVSFYKVRSHKNAWNPETHNVTSIFTFLRYAQTIFSTVLFIDERMVNNLWYSHRYYNTVMTCFAMKTCSWHIKWKRDIM